MFVTQEPVSYAMTGERVPVAVPAHVWKYLFEVDGGSVEVTDPSGNVSIVEDGCNLNYSNPTEDTVTWFFKGDAATVVRHTLTLSV